MVAEGLRSVNAGHVSTHPMWQPLPGMTGGKPGLRPPRPGFSCNDRVTKGDPSDGDYDRIARYEQGVIIVLVIFAAAFLAQSSKVRSHFEPLSCPLVLRDSRTHCGGTEE